MAFSLVITGCNDHEYVDLGLPSGTKWATCNIGAEKPQDYGDYFAWGETEPKEVYNTYTYNDNPTILPADHDAAAVNWGNGWRMPTIAELQELKDNCVWEWTTQNNVNGYLVTGPNGNSIFLPAAGDRRGTSLSNSGSYGTYWSSSVDDTDYAWYLFFVSDGHELNRSNRYCGQPVRAVCQ